MKRPTLLAIKSIMSNLPYKIVYYHDGKIKRILDREISDSESKILTYLKLDESIYLSS